jgi:hypothetical protein
MHYHPELMLPLNNFYRQDPKKRGQYKLFTIFLHKKIPIRHSKEEYRIQNTATKS